jgi:hypothetical protein
MNYERYYYIYIEEDGERYIIRLCQEYDWKIDYITGESLELYYDYKNDIDDIIEDLQNKFSSVQEISYTELDDYMN